MADGTIANIPLLTGDELDAIRAVADGPGRLARSWTLLTRLVRKRLAPEATPAPIQRVYRDRTHFLGLQLGRDQALHIEFGPLRPSGAPVPVGRLSARWDGLGLTGPYRILLREREETINTFCAVLEPYLHLPAWPADAASPAGSPARARAGGLSGHAA